MHKGKQRNIKGAICNVPVECDQACNQLPHPSDRSCIIILKLKRKLQSRGHVYFQASRPELIQQVLNWLKVHNTKIYWLILTMLILTILIATSQLYKMMQTIMIHINKLHQTM